MDLASVPRWALAETEDRFSAASHPAPGPKRTAAHPNDPRAHRWEHLLAWKWTTLTALVLIIAGYYLPAAYRLWDTLVFGDSQLFLATKLRLDPTLLPAGGLAYGYNCCQPTMAPLIDAWLHRATGVNLAVLEYLWLLAQVTAAGVGMYLVGRQVAGSRWGGLLCAALALGFSSLYSGGLSQRMDFGPFVRLHTLGTACVPLVLWAYLAGRLELAYVLASACFALHPLYGAAMAIVPLPEVLRRLITWRTRWSPLRGPLLFGGVGLLCAAVWAALGDLDDLRVTLPAGVSQADFWNLLWLHNPYDFFAFSLREWRERWNWFAATTIWVLAVTRFLTWKEPAMSISRVPPVTEPWSPDGPGAYQGAPLSRCVAWRMTAGILLADGITIVGAVLADLFRNIPVGTLLLPRIYVVVLVLEHAVLAALVVRNLRRARSGELLVALLTLWLATWMPALPLSYALGLLLWCYLALRRGMARWWLGAAGYGAILLAFGGRYLLGITGLTGPTSPWLWLPLPPLALATWLDSSGPSRLTRLGNAVHRGWPSHWVGGLSLVAVLLPTGMSWARNVVTWPCPRDQDGYCVAQGFGFVEAWYQVQRAAYDLTPRGSRILAPYTLPGFEFFSERESALEWEYAGMQYNRAQLTGEFERLRLLGFDLSPGPAGSGAERARLLVREQASFTAQQWRDLAGRVQARYVVIWRGISGPYDPAELALKVLYTNNTFALLDLGAQ